MEAKLDRERIRREETEYGFLRGVKEMVRQKVEMGMMPWGKRIYYPKMFHKARPQKLSDFLVEGETWKLNKWREVELEKWGDNHHLNKFKGRYYMGLLFKSSRGRALRRKISLGTEDEKEARERRDVFYGEWVGKEISWSMANGAQWNMRVTGYPEIGEKSWVTRKAEKEVKKEHLEQARAMAKEWQAKRKAQVALEGFKKETEKIKRKRKSELNEEVMKWRVRKGFGK